MRKVIVGTFLSLDGVMQAPGALEEDKTGGFRFGGWLVPYFDEKVGAAVGNTFGKPYDLLLGRFTYDIFAAHWPYVEKDKSKPAYDEGTAEMGRAFDKATKFVATHHPETMKWENSKALGSDVAQAVRDLKKTEGPDLVVQGSGELVRQLLAVNLVDHLNLLVFPVILGKGKRLFGDDAAPRGFRLTKTVVSDTGVVAAFYENDSEVKIASFPFGPSTPSEEEIERRKRNR